MSAKKKLKVGLPLGRGNADFQFLRVGENDGWAKKMLESVVILDL